MSKDSKKTIQNKQSEVKTAFERIDREFFMLYCDDNEILKESMDDLMSIARSSDDEKVRIDIRKFLIDQLIGKARQSTDITTKDKPLNAGIFIDNG